VLSPEISKALKKKIMEKSNSSSYVGMRIG